MVPDSLVRAGAHTTLVSSNFPFTPQASELSVTGKCTVRMQGSAMSWTWLSWLASCWQTTQLAVVSVACVCQFAGFLPAVAKPWCQCSHKPHDQSHHDLPAWLLSPALSTSPCEKTKKKKKTQNKWLLSTLGLFPCGSVTIKLGWSQHPGSDSREACHVYKRQISPEWYRGGTFT